MVGASGSGAANWSVTLLLSGLLSVVTGCGGGGGGSSSAPPSSSNPPSSQPELASLTPSSFDIDIAANQSSSAQFSIANSGDAALTYSVSASDAWITIDSGGSGSVGDGSSANVAFSVACGSQPLSGGLTVDSNDADEPSVAVPVTVTCTPVVSNYEVAKVTLNQAARVFDSTASSTLNFGVVAGRELLVRAFVTGAGVPPTARVVLSSPGTGNQTFPMQTPPAIGSTPADESILTASHYVVIPAAAVPPSAELTVEVNPGAGAVTYPQSGTLDLSAADPGEFQVTFVPVTFEGETPTIVADDYLRQTLEVLPVGSVDVEVRAPYVFTGAYDLDRLLDEMADLRDLDGSSRLYHGIIIPPGGSTSGTAGIGYVGFPVSASIDLGGSLFVIAHEIGHNLNLGHAPGCDAPGADPSYPYTNGAVATWGFNITSDVLVAPTATRRDFMTYCGDLWVSDYHFDMALDYRNQSPVVAAPPQVAGMTISGRVAAADPTRGVTRLTMVPTDKVAQSLVRDGQDLPYEFIAWDRFGNRIARHAFSTYKVEDHQPSSAFVFSIQRPAVPIDHYEIRYRGAVIDAAGVDAQRTASPPVVNVSWDRHIADITWQPQPGQALLLADADGRILSVDRTGRVALDSRLSDAFVARVTADGQMMTQAAPIRRSDTVVEWVR